jgi:hypothetical protein
MSTPTTTAPAAARKTASRATRAAVMTASSKTSKPAASQPAIPPAEPLKLSTAHKRAMTKLCVAAIAEVSTKLPAEIPAELRPAAKRWLSDMMRYFAGAREVWDDRLPAGRRAGRRSVRHRSGDPCRPRAPA